MGELAAYDPGRVGQLEGGVQGDAGQQGSRPSAYKLVGEEQRVKGSMVVWRRRRIISHSFSFSGPRFDQRGVRLEQRTGRACSSVGRPNPEFRVSLSAGSLYAAHDQINPGVDIR